MDITTIGFLVFLLAATIAHRRQRPRTLTIQIWCVLKDAMFSRVKVPSGQAPERPVADSRREERSDRTKRSVESP